MISTGRIWIKKNYTFNLRNVTFAKQARSEVPSPSDPPKHKWFPFEIWNEHREACKKIIGHSFLFTILMTGLLYAHWLIGMSTLNDHEKEAFKTIDVFGMGILLVIFIIDLIMKMILIGVKSAREEVNELSKHK